jgi:hypothetical protein
MFLREQAENPQLLLAKNTTFCKLNMLGVKKLNNIILLLLVFPLFLVA